MTSDLEERVAAIEERLGMEAGLRASQDRDLATLSQRQSAANHLIQALAITQAQHTEEFTAVHAKLDALGSDVGTLKTDVGTLKTDVGTINGKLDGIIDKLNGPNGPG